MCASFIRAAQLLEWSTSFAAVRNLHPVQAAFRCREIAVLTLIKTPFTYSCCGALVVSAASAFGATPTVNGQSGYINMPSAVVERDSTLSVGYGHDRPYGSFWVTSTVLPFLQITGRYVSINGIPGFTFEPGQYGSEYGRYKDKVVDAKLRLVQESTWMPSVAVGVTDLLGTELFKGQYVVATKTFGQARNIEASLGYGNKRPDGVFGGVRWAPVSMPGWAAVAEYDANDYPRDFRAGETAAGQRDKGVAVGLEYRWGWLGAQIARHRDHFSANAYVSIPFAEREFLPKLLEPAPFDPKKAPDRVSAAEWQKNAGHGAQLVQALARQNFRNIRVELDSGTLKLTLTNSRISNMGRAVGRATRTALAFAPQGTRAIHVTYTRLEQPIATYEFFDLQRLTDYFTGLVEREAFLQTVLVRYANPADRVGEDESGLLAAVRDESAGLGVRVNQDGEMIQLRSEDRESNRFRIAPRVSFFFNDPSGALRYEVAAVSNFDKRLGEGLYFNSALKLNLFENVSGVTQASNSLLPHVRTDVAEYKRGSRFKINRALLNKYMTLDERLYARVSGGLYEEMYRGAGGQILYLPRDSRWAVDLSVDALEQRGFKGLFDKRDYRTVTALGALHYKLPYDMTVTARAGRFLARDEGVRMEFKRRFPSGVEIGAWYTKTSGKDITNPGTPTDPYNDKGVFLSVPLNIMLLSDTQASAGFAIAPWTRDVGQMVASPGDLYDLMEDPRRDLSTADGLGNFAERKDEQNHPGVNPPVRTLPSPWPAFRWRLEQSVSNSPTLPQWAKGSLLAGGAVLAGAALDKPADKFVAKHQDSRVVDAWGNVGKAMPVALAGAAGAAVAFGDARMQNIGIISLQSIAASGGLSMLTKRIVQRARPSEELGTWHRTANRSDASFPSNHAAVAFAAVTPFAQEYDAPWLYGLAAVGSMGRVAEREHWVSDVVAGGMVGYAIGSWLWQAQRDDSRSQFAVVPGSKSLSVSWSTTY
ncbi:MULTISPECIES: YjbH domain-containing protein [unclassified Massilia]|uniref:YjbH domain-containing protein n=1 Tax=unclassified Massilia TaxID=2609279 RepID=UPI00178503AE|nr:MULTISPECIES: YjbH domain-containing protein [unclassified Massilia]MBD8528786.1 YjbH domain-containing protein [Massilia sp. CFBP 13647]MBD8673427.1 YjbH domain-containing protein [Massilia sp. CFBP 13721]